MEPNSPIRTDPNQLREILGQREPRSTRAFETFLNHRRVQSQKNLKKDKKHNESNTSMMNDSNNQSKLTVNESMTAGLNGLDDEQVQGRSKERISKGEKGFFEVRSVSGKGDLLFGKNGLMKLGKELDRKRKKTSLNSQKNKRKLEKENVPLNNSCFSSSQREGKRNSSQYKDNQGALGLGISGGGSFMSTKETERRVSGPSSQILRAFRSESSYIVLESSQSREEGSQKNFPWSNEQLTQRKTKGIGRRGKGMSSFGEELRKRRNENPNENSRSDSVEVEKMDETKGELLNDVNHGQFERLEINHTFGKELHSVDCPANSNENSFSSLAPRKNMPKPKEIQKTMENEEKVARESSKLSRNTPQSKRNPSPNSNLRRPSFDFQSKSREHSNESGLPRRSPSNHSRRPGNLHSKMKVETITTNTPNSREVFSVKTPENLSDLLKAGQESICLRQAVLAEMKKENSRISQEIQKNQEETTDFCKRLLGNDQEFKRLREYRIQLMSEVDERKSELKGKKKELDDRISSIVAMRHELEKRKRQLVERCEGMVDKKMRNRERHDEEIQEMVLDYEAKEMIKESLKKGKEHLRSQIEGRNQENQANSAMLKNAGLLLLNAIGNKK